MRKKNFIVLAIAAILAFSLGQVFAQEPKAKVAQKQAKAIVRADQVQVKLNQLNKELKLTPEQQQKVKSILTDSTDEAKGMLEAAREKIKEIRVKAHDEIMKLLTPQQQEKFKVTRKKHEAVNKLEE